MPATGDDWVHALRAELPVLQRYVYLNTGTAGPTPRCVERAMREEADFELREGRGNFATFERYAATCSAVRRRVARLLGVKPQEIALTHQTTDGINIVLQAIDWRPGDEVVTTTLEHDAVAVPLALLRHHRGVASRFAPIGQGERAVEGIGAALSPRTRLVVLSHVVYSSGALLPLTEIVELAHRQGARVLVDGAQTAGVLPLDLAGLGVDYYTVSGQKWLCGPEGTGALFVAGDRPPLTPALGSVFNVEHHDFRGGITLRPDARRYEFSMMHRPSLAGFAASLGWILDEVGVERAWQRSVALAASCRRQLARVDGVEIVTPEALASPLVTCDLPGWPPAKLHSAAMLLVEREGIVCRSIDHPPYGLRAAFGFFNTERDVGRFVEAVARLHADGPEIVPLAGWADRLPTTREPERKDQA